ncbi:MAG: NAD(P)H-hydrate dehydratase [Oscillospiraceae bacterium]|nr:NAD(P)H-hydrate dehydratase [Oscillospiraceae bacterium]
MKEITENLVKPFIRKRTSDSHKGTYGTLLSITGSKTMPGAAMLSGKAALRSGLGLLKQCAAEICIPAFAASFHEPVYLPLKTEENGFYSADNAELLLNHASKSSAVLIGCGLGYTEGTSELVRRVLKNITCPVVIDADALNCIAENPEILNEIKPETIITPHPAEAARLLGVSTAEIQIDRYGAIQEFIRRFPKTVTVLKGAGTLVGYGENVFINRTGNPGMSTGGSGDVLAGIAGAFAAQGIDVQKAALLAVWIHGSAGDRAAERLSMHSMLPEDIIDELAGVFKGIERTLK